MDSGDYYKYDTIIILIILIIILSFKLFHTMDQSIWASRGPEVRFVTDVI